MCPSTASSDDATGTTTTCTSEQEVYELLGLAYIEPELRENRGELAAAAPGSGPTHATTPNGAPQTGLPELIELSRHQG